MSASFSHAPANTGLAPAPGYLRIRGNLLLDDAGRTFRIAGVNWFGFETNTFALHGLSLRSGLSHLEQIRSLGFNTVRLPFCLQMFDAKSRPRGISHSANPDLSRLSPASILDRVIELAGRADLRVILDCHRSDAGGGPNANGLWFTPDYGEERWVSTWTMLARRYHGNPTVIGADLLNEPHGAATWGPGDPGTDWRLAAERAGNAILAANPNWLIFVEGVDNGPSGHYWWGGNLSAAREHPVRLAVPDRLVYSSHDYPASIYEQPWFSARGYPRNLPAVWDRHWGYLFRENIAPVFLGEFGSRLRTPTDRLWLQQLVAYLGGSPGPGAQGISWAWWSWNPNSEDTGGILNDDWQTPIAAKLEALRPIQFPISIT